MLATILAGIALGSYLITPILDRRVRWLAVLATVEMILAVVMVWSFGPLVHLPAFSGWLTPLVARIAPAWLGYPIAGSLLVILPSSLLMGLAFPIGLRVWTDGGSGGATLARRVGRFRGARLFSRINYDVLARPNVRLHVDDGRNYMLLTEKRYDVITADAILPIYAGAGNLYSAEYFRLMRRLLNPGGWLSSGSRAPTRSTR